MRSIGVCTLFVITFTSLVLLGTDAVPLLGPNATVSSTQNDTERTDEPISDASSSGDANGMMGEDLFSTVMRYYYPAYGANYCPPGYGGGYGYGYPASYPVAYPVYGDYHHHHDYHHDYHH